MKGEVGQGVRVASRTLDVKAVEVGAGNDDGDVEHVAVAGGWVRRDDGGGYIIRLVCRKCIGGVAPVPPLTGASIAIAPRALA